jgi:monovalent cation:proton antiporter-2 (CPA2) family protein
MDHDLLFAAFVYLSVAVLAVPLASRLGLGSVLGYLGAGIAIGPFALNLTGEGQDDIMHFAEFGVVMMLFLIGLELQPQVLWRLRRKILGLGGLQVVFSSLALMGIGMAAGLAWQSALAVGMILALSSTAIVMQSLEEKGWTRSPGGRASFTVLLFQDMAVIPILALLPLLALPQGLPHAASDEAHAVSPAASSLIAHLPIWAQGIAALASIAAIILAGRFLLRPIFRIIALQQSRELFTAFTLFLVVAISLLMRALGLSMALGTFLAGVVLADSEYRHELENNIQPFKGLLLGLFFIAVGSSIDFALIWESWALVLALTLGLLLVKLLILLSVGFAFDLRGSQLALFTLALAQGGEFAFVLFSFATQNSVLSAELAGRLTAVVALTMLVTPLLLIAYERLLLPWLERRQVTREEDEVEDHEPRVILAGYGAFGTLVGRLLIANRVPTTILDFNPEQIDRMRVFGFKVYYGDATRIELLELAGIAKAELLVVAIGDADAAIRLVEEVKRLHPHVTIIARAADRPHYRELKRAGADIVVRQYLQSAMFMGQAILTSLGFRAFTARRRAQAFERHDMKMIDAMALEEMDDKTAAIIARSASEQIERALHQDSAYHRPELALDPLENDPVEPEEAELPLEMEHAVAGRAP